MTFALTNYSYNISIALVMGVKTQIQCSCPTALVASYNNSELHYDRRALNKVAIPNKAGLSLYGFFTLLSPLYQVTREKENTMNESLNPESLNPESLSSLTLTDILNDLLLSIEELSCILASSQDSIPASCVVGLLRNITNSTCYQLTKEGANNV